MSDPPLMQSVPPRAVLPPLLPRTRSKRTDVASDSTFGTPQQPTEGQLFIPDLQGEPTAEEWSSAEESMTNAAKHILAIKSLLAYDTPIADPRCVAIAGQLVNALCKMFEPYQTVAGNAHARALDLMLRWSGDHDFNTVIDAGSFAAELQSA